MKTKRKYRKTSKKKTLYVATVVIIAIVVSIIYTMTKDICMVFFP